MKRIATFTAAVAIAAFVAPGLANSEILAMMNYETKPAESLKELKLTVARERKERYRHRRCGSEFAGLRKNPG